MFGNQECRALSVMKQQGIGSLFRCLVVIISVLSLGACSAGQTGPVAKNVIVHNNHERIESSWQMGWKLYEDLKWNLPESSTKLHNNAVMIALRQSKTGESVSLSACFSSAKRWLDCSI